MLANEGGGISSVSYGLARGLARKKIQTTIFFSTAARREKRHEVIDDCFEVVRFPLMDRPPRSMWFHLRYFHTITKSLKDYTLVHAVSPEIAFGSTVLGKRSRPPLITTLHGSNRAALKAFLQLPTRSWALSDFAFHVLELPLHETIAKRCFAKSDGMTACSFTTLNELKTCEGFDASKIRVIHNGVDLDEIKKAEANAASLPRENGDELSIIYAGRLFWMKGITLALEAFEKLAPQFKNLQFNIYGRGPLQEEVKRFARSRGLSDQVHYGGFLPHRRLIEEIHKSDLVVFPSVYESQPMFALEAMACRRPVVAFDLPYARELIENGRSGLLAKPYDVKDLSSKMAMALCDRKLRMKLGERARQYVEKNHNWDTQTGEYLRYYEKIVQQAK